MVANWAGNITYTPATVHRPRDVAQLQEIVAGARRAKALGTGHSFNPIADTDGELISTADLPPTIEVDAAARTVTVGGGVRFGELAPALEQHGFALPNLGSLPHISVAGAYATGTHGSGDGNQVLAGSVRRLRLVTADGQLRTVAGPDLDCWTVGLGAVGIVTELTLQLIDSFQVRQYVYTGLSRERLIADLDEIMAAAYSASVFTGWTGTSRIWLKVRDGEPRPPAGWLGTAPAGGPEAPIPGADTRAVTAQLGEPVPWFAGLPHFRPEFTPSWGEELQSEYFVSRADGPAAVAAVSELAQLLAPVLLISELRTVAADEFWVSPAQGADRLALHFTWVRDPAAVAPVVSEVERRLAPFAARPHWGKVSSVAPATLARLYPRLAEFAAHVRRCDPGGTFGNAFLDRYLPS